MMCCDFHAHKLLLSLPHLFPPSLLAHTISLPFPSSSFPTPQSGFIALYLNHRHVLPLNNKEIKSAFATIAE